MSQIQQGRYDALLRRVADLKGPGSKVNDVLEELFPMFDVENLPDELFVLGQIDTCYGGAVVENVVAQAGRGQLFNPVGSGKIMSITHAVVSATAVAVFRWGRQDVPHTSNFSTQLFADVRHPFGNLPTGQIRGQTSVALANANGQTLSLSNTPFILKPPNGLTVLTEGTGFEIGMDALDQDFFFTFYWRERVAEPSEINF